MPERSRTAVGLSASLELMSGDPERGSSRRHRTLTPNERSAGLLNRARYPSDVAALVVLWRLRYRLTLRDLSEMFLQRGLAFGHEAVRDWEAKLAPMLAGELRWRRHWHVDETCLRVRGRWAYLYRAIDRDGRGQETQKGRQTRHGGAPARAEESLDAVVGRPPLDRRKGGCSSG